MHTLDSLTTENTLADACYAFIASPFIQNRLDRSPRAGEPYRSIASAHTSISSLKLSELSRRKVAQFRDSLTAKGYSAGTINGILSKLRRLGDKLVDYELIPSNFFREVGNPAPTSRKRQTRVLTAVEVSLVLQELAKANPGYADAFAFSLETSMRLGEVVGIRAEHVMGTRLWVPVSLDKSKKGRIVFLNASAQAILATRLAGVSSPDALLFPFKRDTLRQALWRIKKRTGLPVFWHLSRHTAISRAAMHTTSLRELMAFSGHRTIVALQGYLHTDERDLEQAVLSALPEQLAPRVVEV